MLRPMIVLALIAGPATASPDFANMPGENRPLAASTGTRPIEPTGEVMFALDSAALDDPAGDEIADVAAWLDVHAGWRIVLEGHTDRTGPSAYNEDLARLRAEVVRRRLLAIGFAADRFIVAVCGEAPNASSAERRVVIYASALPVEKIAATSRCEVETSPVASR